MSNHDSNQDNNVNENTNGGNRSPNALADNASRGMGDESDQNQNANNNNVLKVEQIKFQDGGSSAQKSEKRGSLQSSNSRHDSRRQSTRQKDKVVDIFDEQQEEENKCPVLAKLLDGNIFNFVITVITVYALFGDDCRIIFFNKHADPVFDTITIIALVSFSAEITMSVFAKPGYKFSFFFWLDFISTLSLILDIQFISNAIFYGDDSKVASTINLARAGRTSRIGTKAGRVVRLVRLIRIVKLYKASTDIKTQKKNIEAKILEKRTKKGKHKGIAVNDAKDQKATSKAIALKLKEEEKAQPKSVQKESRVSKKLSDKTTKRVIIIVLSLLFIMPLFNSDYYNDFPGTVDFQVKLLENMSNSEKPTLDQIAETYEALVSYGKGLDTPTVEFSNPFGNVDDKYYEDHKEYINKFKNFKNSIIDDLRQSETTSAAGLLDVDKACKKLKDDYPKVCDGLKTIIDKSGGDTEENLDLIFSITINTRSTEIFSSGLSLGRTLFVCVVLTMGALLFSKDANDLALRPIERMIEKVNQIARNPNDAKSQDVIEEKGKDQYETVIIENAITKIGTLLALGFGDAGSEIIGSNMQKVGDVDPLIPGKKKICIYGFCDIRQFTDATEQLQEKVMIFVNNIGQIVHSMVDRYLGAANKNIGDAFLLIWKIPDEKVEINEQTNNPEYKELRYVNILSDFSAISFMKIQAKINREPCILDYRQNDRLLERFPNYKVRIGYGLHIGWSIEGAIGSEFKIDASYLSPNVKMSERLQDSTKQYGIPLLISEDLFNNFTDGMKKYTRKVDSVKFRGCEKPMFLYTIDMFEEKLPPSKGNVKELIEKQMDAKIKREEIKEHIEKDTWDADEHMTNNKDLRLLLTERNEKKEFFDGFNVCIEQYIEGQWDECKAGLEKIEHIHPTDGPAKVLMEKMKENNYKCPADWQKYTNLNE